MFLQKNCGVFPFADAVAGPVRILHALCCIIIAEYGQETWHGFTVMQHIMDSLLSCRSRAI